MSRYDATDDPLCYPGTAVLKNLADLLDQDDLDQFEQLMFLTRSEEPLPAIWTMSITRPSTTTSSKMSMIGRANRAKYGPAKAGIGSATQNTSTPR